MLLCVFDTNDLLTAYKKIDQVQLNAEYLETIVTGSGQFSVVAWTGINPLSYEIQTLSIGATQKNDLLFRLRRNAGQAYSIEGTKIYFGEHTSVEVPEQMEENQRFVPVSINLLEVTNRLTVSLTNEKKNLDYAIDIESGNCSMNLDETVAWDETIRYSHTDVEEDGILESDFTLLKLEPALNNTLVITRKSTGKEIYRANLLKELLAKNPYLNFDCDHDFNIEIVTDGSYMILEIWVNEWPVHSYEIEM